MERRLIFAISADYERRTGGWIYDMRLLAELESLGWRIEHLTLPAGFPDPDAAARASTLEAFAALPSGTLVLVESLVLSVMPELTMAEAQRLRLVALLHHPLALEAGLTDERRSLAEQEERAALAGARRIVVTSPTTAAQLRDHYDVPATRITVAVPGVDPQPLFEPGDEVPSLLAVGAVVPRKDHGTLLSALATVAEFPWFLRVVGNLTRAPDHVAAVQALAAAPPLAGRVQFEGELDDRELERAWRSADLFVSASRHEGYGMAVAEALARGLPVVATTAGALADWLPREAALGVSPGDVAGLASALRRILAEPGLRCRLSQGAISFRPRLPRWGDTARTVETALLGAIS